MVRVAALALVVALAGCEPRPEPQASDTCLPPAPAFVDMCERRPALTVCRDYTRRCLLL